MVAVGQPPFPSMRDAAMVPARGTAVAPFAVALLAAAFLLDLAEVGSALLFPAAFASFVLAPALGLAGAAGLTKQACWERLLAL